MEKERKFKCIKELHLPKYDDYECMIENEFFIVPAGSEWEIQEHSSMSDIRLESNDFGWLEITFDTMKDYFVEIN